MLYVYVIHEPYYVHLWVIKTFLVTEPNRGQKQVLRILGPKQNKLVVCYEQAILALVFPIFLKCVGSSNGGIKY